MTSSSVGPAVPQSAVDLGEVEATQEPNESEPTPAESNSDPRSLFMQLMFPDISLIQQALGGETDKTFQLAMAVRYGQVATADMGNTKTAQDYFDLKEPPHQRAVKHYPQEKKNGTGQAAVVGDAAGGAGTSGGAVGSGGGSGSA